jgi:hypothetical protein
MIKKWIDQMLELHIRRSEHLWKFLFDLFLLMIHFIAIIPIHTPRKYQDWHLHLNNSNMCEVVE